MDADRLADALASAAAGVRAPGAVAAVRRAGVTTLAATGATTVATGTGADVRPVGVDDWFEIGSVTKSMTATLVLQLVADGRLSVDDPVVAHLPRFRLARDADTASVTVRHLLTHTGGIDGADDFTDTGAGDDCLERYLVEVVAGSDQLDPPGRRWSYSNSGYAVLGRLVEVVGGATWDDAVRDRVIEPSGMAASTTRRIDRSRLVPGHRLDGDDLVVDSRPMPSSIGPAGNVVATVDALARYASALLVERSLLDTALVDEMARGQVPMDDGSYGFGWMVPVDGVDGHGGSTIGHTAFLGAVPSLGGVLAVLANGPGAGTIAQRLREDLYGMADPRAPAGAAVGAPASASTAEAAALVGTKGRRHVEVDVGRGPGGLTATIRRSGPVADLFGDEPTVDLVPGGDRRFTSTRPDGQGTDTWTFVDEDEHGVPTGLLTQRLHRRVP
jgi:CubicO group peptidase (beta-lactamase class C family)